MGYRTFWAHLWRYRAHLWKYRALFWKRRALLDIEGKQKWEKEGIGEEN